MNTATFFVSGALVLAASLPHAMAQSDTSTQTAPPAKGSTAPSVAHTASTAPATPVRASDIIGTEITDASGEDIAEIKDLVVCDSGKLLAVVEVSARDDALVGVPLEQLEARCDKEREAKAMDKDGSKVVGAETPDIETFALKGDRTLFDGAPLLADEKALDGVWIKDCSDHYAGKKAAARSTSAGDQAAVTMAAKPACVKQLIGENVNGSDGDGIGDVKDLAIDLRNSQVAYAIVSTGGVLGMGDTLHAIPFERLTIQEDVVVIPMTKETVAQLPKLDLDRLPSASPTAMPKHDRQVHDGSADRASERKDQPRDG